MYSSNHPPKSPLQNRSYSQGIIPTQNHKYQLRSNMSFSAHSSPMFKRNSSESDKAGSIKSSHSRSSFGSMISSLFQSQSHSHKSYKSSEDRISINSELTNSSNIPPTPRRFSSKHSSRGRPQSVMYCPINNGQNEKQLNRQIYYKPPSNSRHESLCCTLNRSDRTASSIRDSYYTPQLRETHYIPNSPINPSLGSRNNYIPNRSPNIPFIDISTSAMQDVQSISETENKDKIIQTMRSNSSLNTSISSKQISNQNVSTR